MNGALTEIWLSPVAAGPMRRVPDGELVVGAGLQGDRYALGGGTWVRYPPLEKQLTLIDVDDVAAVARDTGSALLPGATRRNLITAGLPLADLVGGWFAVGQALMFGMKRCPPCAHLERLSGVRLVKAMAYRGGINAAVFVGARIYEGDLIRPVTDDEAEQLGAPTGVNRPVPRRV